MRLGVMGPAGGDLDLLTRAASMLLDQKAVDRVLYLGPDDAIDRAMPVWARSLVSGEPTPDGLWDRAFTMALAADGESIRQGVVRERARRKLSRIETLEDAKTRAIELLAGRPAIFLHDKAHLDEDDIFSATFLVFGRSESPVVKAIGARWFLSPGVLKRGQSGVMLFEEGPSHLDLALLQPDGTVVESHILEVSPGARFQVQGES